MIYLDNAATTKPFPKIKQIVDDIIDSNYANPSSMHGLGLSVHNIVKNVQKKVASVLNVSSDEIYFTSGGTESNNLALTGVAKAYSHFRSHIITSEIEHPSVYETVKMLSENNIDIDILPVDEYGMISMNELKSKIRNDTVLVSLNHVNNEIGSVYNVDEIGNIIKCRNPNTLFHVDAVQSFGKFKIFPVRSSIDLLSLSAHKIHGLKGSGALYIRKGIKVKPIIYGGGQQKKLRSGTENVIGIAALGEAIKILCDINDSYTYVSKLKQLLIDGIIKNFKDIKINGQSFELDSPYILSVCFVGLKGEILLNALSERGIYVSTGSACNSKKSRTSRVLKAIGLKENEIQATIRFSLSVLNTKRDVELCVEALKEIIHTFC